MNGLTVFLLTVNRKLELRCMESLGRQTLTPDELVVIANVSPLSKAMQTQLDKCKTEFFFTLDEDAQLYENALETLRKYIIAAPENVAEVVCRYDDEFLTQGTANCRIYKHGIAKQFPFEDKLGCDRVQYEAMEKAGYVVERHKDRLGKHAFGLTNEEVFKRFEHLLRRRMLVGGNVADIVQKIIAQFGAGVLAPDYVRAAFAGAMYGLGNKDTKSLTGECDVPQSILEAVTWSRDTDGLQKNS